MTAQPDPRPTDATLSVTKAAHMLGVHPNTVRSWSEQGRLRYYRINARGDRRYRVGDLRRFLADAERGDPLAGSIGDRGRPTPAAVRGDRGQAGSPPRLTLNSAPQPGGQTMPLGARALSEGQGPFPASAPAGSTLAIRHLVDLAELVSAGHTLDGVLHSAARLIRDSTGASDVAIWELREDRLVRRAGSTRTGSAVRAPGPLNAALQALTQRRPVVEPAGPPDLRPGTSAGRTATAPQQRALDGFRAMTSMFGVDVAVPILTDNPWGVLAVQLPDLVPGHETVAWLEAAAALLAGSVRSAALLDEAAQELHRGEALRRVAMDTSGSLDLDETLARVVEHAMVLFGADRGGVFIRQPDGEILASASRGLSASYLASVRHFPTPSLPADAARERRPMFAINYSEDPRSQAFRAAVVQEGFDTICAAPLLDGDDTIGLLILYHDRSKEWTPAELETMAAFASQATVAVRTAQQFTQLSRWAAQLQSIQQLGARLNRLTTIPEIASTIATELRVLIEYDNIRVYRLEGEALNAVALQATDAIYLDETPELVGTRIGEGITGWVAAHGIAQNLPDSSADPRTQDIPGSDAFDESMLLAPLVFEDRVLGVIALASQGLNQFGDDDLRLLEIYASIAAQAMANADATQRLRAQSEALQRQLRSQRELLEITESILSTLDPRAVLNQIAHSLGRLVRYDTLAIDLHDRHRGILVPLIAQGPDGEARPHPPTVDDVEGWVIARNEARLVPGTPLEDEGLPSRIVVPLRGRDGVTGVLTLSRARDGESFTSDEFELVQLFAAQVSIALQNAETHRAVEVRAETDDLTGLLNHGSLREWLSRSAAAGTPFSLIMLDLDEFKAINDAFGHQAGDRLLSEIGAAITAAGRETDLVFRYGGDEFAVILPRTDTRGAMEVADRIRSAVHRVGGPGGRQADELDMTASIGVATFPADGATGADILLAADRACFVAKRGGRDRIADAAKGLSLAAEFSLQEPTPVDSSDPRWTSGDAAAPQAARIVEVAAPELSALPVV
jgi:diguanylate cyclase (GGDEF)-like protein/excisionase family DNA binding protein